MNRYWLILIGFPVVAVPAGYGGIERVRSNEALRILSLPPTFQATILRKFREVRSSRRGSTTYPMVVLKLPDGEVMRRVSPLDFEAAQIGGTTSWHVDSAASEGIAEIERTERTTGMYIPYGLAFMFAFLLCSGIATGLATGAKVRRGGPGASDKANPALPPPPREATPRWRDWMSKKYPPLRRLLPIPVVGALLFAGGFLIVGFREPAAVMAVQGAMALSVMFASRFRGLARDRRLWTQGVELPARLVEAKITGKAWLIEASFTSAGENFTLSQRWPMECDRPAPRVLVDPRSPRRATVVSGV